jgi:hypothetical protein
MSNRSNVNNKILVPECLERTDQQDQDKDKGPGHASSSDVAHQNPTKVDQNFYHSHLL